MNAARVLSIKGNIGVRATGFTDYLKNTWRIEVAHHMAGPSALTKNDPLVLG